MIGMSEGSISTIFQHGIPSRLALLIFFLSHYFSILFVFIDISGRGCCREQVHQIQKLGPTPLIVGKVLAHSFNESYTLIIKVQGHRITMTRNLEQ